MSSKVKEFQAIITVSSEGNATLADAMNDLRKGISKKIKKMKEEEGDVNVVSVSQSSSYSDSKGYFASAALIVDVSDPWSEIVIDEEAKEEPGV